MLERPEEGQIKRIEVTVVSLQGSTLTVLSVGNKRSKQFFSTISEKWAAEHRMLEKMQEAGVKSVVVSAKAAYRGTTIIWTVMSDFAEVEAQISAQIAAHNERAFLAREYLRKQAEYKERMKREKEERDADQKNIGVVTETNNFIFVEVKSVNAEELKAARKAAKQAEKAAKIAAKKGRVRI